MNEWLKRLTESIRNLWAKGTVVQKIVLFALVALVIVAIVLAASLSSRPTTVRLFNSPVTDQTARTRILDKLSEQNVEAYVTDDGYISVGDERTARRSVRIVLQSKLVDDGRRTKRAS